MKTVKILHCADIHLGSDFRALGRKAVSRRADLKNTFLNIINICKTSDIDILFVIGDIFESWTVQEENFTLTRDAFADIPDTKVIISAGNHDPLSYNSPYLKENFWSDNVFIMPTEYSSILFDDLETEVWGASFSSAYVENSIFKKATPQNPDYIQIGAIHGMLGSDGQVSPYNPISTAQIANSGLVYLALGHTHKFSGILKEKDTFYAYPGCPEGRGFDELGEKGVLIGTVSKNHCELTFKATSKRMYLEASVDISECNGSHDAASMINLALKEEFGSEYKENLYKVFIKGKVDSSVNLSMDSVKGYLDNLFYVKLRDHTEINIDLNIVANEMTLRGVFVRKMLELMEDDDSPELKESLKLGLKAFSGEVKYSED